MLGHHLTLAVRSRAAVFLDQRLRHAALHKLVAVAGPHLWSFCLVDDHLHAALLLRRQRAAHIASALSRALQALTGEPCAPAHLEAVVRRVHALRLVRYHLRQTRHHELDRLHPATWTGSFFQDLIGARQLGYRLRIGEVLPRFRVRDALAYVELPPAPIPPADDTQLGGLLGLGAAAVQALAADPDLTGKHRPVVRARRAVCQLGRAAGFSRAELARSLGVSPRTVARLASEPADEAVLQAVRMRLAVEQAAARGWKDLSHVSGRFSEDD